MKVKKLTFLLLLLVASSLHAQELKPPLAPLPQSISKQQWQDHIQTNLPPELCKQDQYFIQCFETTTQECVDFTRVLVQACLSNVLVGLPESLDKEKGAHWGQLIARCSYDLYDKFMQKKKKSTQACQNVKPPVASKP